MPNNVKYATGVRNNNNNNIDNITQETADNEMIIWRNLRVCINNRMEFS